MLVKEFIYNIFKEYYEILSYCTNKLIYNYFYKEFRDNKMVPFYDNFFKIMIIL